MDFHHHLIALALNTSITGQMDDVFRSPSSPECVSAVNKIANENWKKYLGEESVDMESHLLPFPLEYKDGKIQPRTGLIDGCFPDTKASVLGKKSLIMPEIFLT